MILSLLVIRYGESVVSSFRSVYWRESPIASYVLQRYQNPVRDDAIDGRIGFETDGQTLCIRDALEGETFPIRFDREPEPQPALPDLFPVPVDRAVSLEAESVSLLVETIVTVRDADGEFVAQLDDSMELPRETYYFDVNGVTKALVRAPDAAVSAAGMTDSEAVELPFDRPTTITIGARSLHTRPEATITVPDDPAALAEADSVVRLNGRLLLPDDVDESPERARNPGSE